MTAKVFAAGNGDVRAVLTGAACSAAFYTKASGGDVCPGCRFCDGETEVSNWEHLCWRCPGFAPTRPSRTPDDLLQLRLGWSAGRVDDAAVLEHMATVRRQLLVLSPFGSSSGR